PSSMMNSRSYPQRNRNNDCDSQGGRRQFDGRRVSLKYSFRHRLVCNWISAKVAVENAAPVIDVLVHQRLVEFQFVLQLFVLLDACVRTEQQTDGIAGDEVNQKKDQCNYGKNDWNRQQQSSKQVD